MGCTHDHKGQQIFKYNYCICLSPFGLISVLVVCALYPPCCVGGMEISSQHGKICRASLDTHMCSRDRCVSILWEPHMVANRYACPSTSKLPPLHAATHAPTTADW